MAQKPAAQPGKSDTAIEVGRTAATARGYCRGTGRAGVAPRDGFEVGTIEN